MLYKVAKFGGTVCNVQFVMCRVQCAVYSVQCSVFSVQCSVCSVHSFSPNYSECFEVLNVIGESLNLMTFPIQELK